MQPAPGRQRAGSGLDSGADHTGSTLEALAALRSQTWWLLGRFYLERPEPSFLSELAAALGAVSTPQAEADADIAALIDCLRDAPLEDLSRRLAREFTRLLRGIQEGAGPPPPYESLYRGQSVGGDLSLAVLNRYRAAGFDAVEPSVGPQDHLGAELRFLALLAVRETQAWAAGDADAALARIDQQQRFLDTHLLAWLPGYAARIETEAREPFYRAAARLTLAFADEARAELDLIDADLQAA